MPFRLCGSWPLFVLRVCAARTYTSVQNLAADGKNPWLQRFFSCVEGLPNQNCSRCCNAHALRNNTWVIDGGYYMTSSRKFERLLQAGCLGLIGMLAAAGCGGSSSPGPKPDGGPDVNTGAEVGPGLGAVLTVNPASVDLGSIDVGVKSAPVTVTVSNVGLVTSGPLTVTVAGTGITATGCSGTTLAKGATCTLTVTALMASAGQFTGTIEVGDTALNTKKISVSGIANIPGEFSLTPAPLDLGTVVMGKSTTGTVIMTNTAKTGLADIVINVSGTGFTDSKTGTCTASLPVGQTCTIIVNFAATTAGAAKGTLSVSQGGVTKPVALSALVQAPAKLVMTPASASFMTVFGTPSSPVTFYVGNAGDVTSAIPTVTLGGANAKDFTFTSDCSAKALTGGATSSCQITVTYNPATASTTNSTATLTVAEPGTGGSTVSATLTGTAVPPSTLSITGTPSDLGIVTVGSTGAATTFTVTNNGGENSGALEITASVGQFVIATNNCADKDLAPKATCTFTAAFKPAAGDQGGITGQLKAKGANTAAPAFIGVSGTAVAQAKLAITPPALEFGSLPTMTESAPLTLVVSNVGGNPTGALRIDNTGAQFKVKGDTCTGASLTATGTTSSCTIVVTYTPAGSVSVDATGTITVTDTTGAAPQPVTATLHGVGIKHADLVMVPSVVCPQFSQDDPLCFPTGGVVSPTALPLESAKPAHRINAVNSAFQNKVVGQTTKELQITVTNWTDPTDAPDSGTLTFAITGDAAADYKIVQNNCTSLLSTSTHTTCVLTLTFTPSAVGLRKAILGLSTSRGGASQATLEGKGLAPVEVQPLQLSKANNGLDFGQESLGNNNPDKILPYRVWIRSTTSADKTTTMTVTLPPATPADFVWPNTGSTTPISLPIGGTDDLLTPPVISGGASNASPFTSYTAVLANGANRCHSKTVSLAVAATGEPTDATKDANAALGYIYDASSGYYYCDFAVQFYPNSARGALTAGLTATGTSAGTSSLTLVGNAVGPLAINPSPMILADPVAVGLASTQNLTLTVTNNGAVTQTGLTFGLSGTGSADFQIMGTSCWSTSRANAIGPVAHALPLTGLDYPTVIDQLASGGKCEVWVGFTPKTEGAYTVVLTVTAANGAGTTDDETATVNLITNGLKTFGALTITPDPATLPDTPFLKTDAAPITLTLKNNGSLDSGLATMSVTSQFEIVNQTGVAGACNSSAQWHVPGSASCTIQLRAKPTAAPVGIGKQLITGTLTVSATPGGTVNVPLSYYEVSNLMIVEGTTAKSSTSYTFPAAGVGADATQAFTVQNIGSSVVTVKVVPAAPFTVDSTSVCINGKLLNPGDTCSLVVHDNHPSTTPVGIPTPVIFEVQDNANIASLARLYLSSITLNGSNLVAFGGASAALPSFNTSGTAVSLGSVPFGTASQSGSATFWFKNIGDVETDALSYKWDNKAASTADDEFKFEAPASETTQDCQNFFGKKLGAKQMCFVKVYFKPLSSVAPAGARTRNLTIMNGNRATNPVVYLAATALSDTANVYVVQDPTLATKLSGFYQFTSAAVVNGAKSETRVFYLINNSGSSVSFSLPATTDAPWQRVAPASPASNECPTGANPLSISGTTTSCQFTLVYAPTSDPGQIYAPGALTVATGVTLGLMGHVSQPASLTVIPPVGLPVLAGPPAGLDMLSIAVGGTTSQTLTIVNTGDAATTALNVALTNADATKATFTQDGGCDGKNLAAFGTVSGGVATDRCLIKVTATGVGLTVPGTTYGELKIKGTGATGAAAEIAYRPTVSVQNMAALTVIGTGTFPTTAVTGYSPATFTIRNTAVSAVKSGTIAVALSGASAGQFQLVGNTCPPNVGLPSYDSTTATECYVTVRFMPTALTTGGDAVTATLNVTATPGSAAPFSLQGIPKSSLTISPVADATANPLTYTIPVGANTTAVQTFTITNEGTASTTNPMKTTITNPAEFMLINDECYGVLLDAGENCIVSVKYIGAATSTAKGATLTVDGGSAGQSVAVNLSYTGAKALNH
jgi:hypothetical protein